MLLTAMTKKGLWQIHLLQLQLQRDQFYRRRYGVSLQLWGIVIGMIIFLRALWRLHNHQRSWLSCSLWWGACCCLTWCTWPYPYVARGSSLSLARGLSAYSHAVFGILAILVLGILVPLIFVWCDMVVVASCKQQHEHLIIAWESWHSSLAFVVFCHCSSQYNIKMIVTLLMLSLWRRNQSYCWRLVLLWSLM